MQCCKKSNLRKNQYHRILWVLCGVLLKIYLCSGSIAVAQDDLSSGHLSREHIVIVESIRTNPRMVGKMLASAANIAVNMSKKDLMMLNQGILCNLLAAGYFDKAEEFKAEMHIDDTVNKQVRDRCIGILEKDITVLEDIDVKWVAYSVSKDERYIKMIIDVIIKGMNLDNISFSDLQYSTLITHNYAQNQAKELLSDILKKLSNDQDKKLLDITTKALWSFGSLSKNLSS